MIQNFGNVRAFAKIKLDDLITYDWRIVQQPGQRAWVSVPQLSWTGSDGKPRYKNMIELPQDLKNEISQMILSHWNN